MRKNVFYKSSSLLLALLASSNLMAAKPEMEGNATNSSSVKNHRILVIGAEDNVKSNYFVTDMLAEDTKIAPDSVCYIYNKVIEDNLSLLAQKSKASYTFVDAKAIQGTCQNILEDIKTTGEGEAQASDLSFVNATQLRSMLDQAGADYLLLLDTHYLKYQEVPFKTIFHYVNYSLYDGNKKKLAQGSNYFTSINPQTEQQMIKSSRKSTAKMLGDVESALTALNK